MSREFKNYGLRSSPRPIYTGRYVALSSSVSIKGADGTPYYCYVSFSDKLVEKAGKLLPQGVSEFKPAFLHVDLSQLQMDVWVCYTVGKGAAKLWSQSLEEDIPEWLKFNKVRGSA